MFGIEDARKEVLAGVEDLTDEQLNREVEEGRWTIAQVLEHLFLIEKEMTRTIEKELAKEDNEPARKKKPIELTLERSGAEREAPEPFQPTSEFMTLAEIKERLDHSRATLMKALHVVEDDAILSQKSAKHPAFGTMDLEQWIEFIGLHERRHLKQIEELKAGL
ncbi:DinB family protein [Natribacillus halophilus]|uniref:DinB superfamily protein n=1 Tax=Natribacillus halophilus TaxID=549003 RepID=A0A1G8KGZ8_9BACI|nr:DinB family protein [Natribacillus halophilus]SDI42678.1 DinB superfamily protein [Natribacillus halophilus]